MLLFLPSSHMHTGTCRHLSVGTDQHPTLSPILQFSYLRPG